VYHPVPYDQEQKKSGPKDTKANESLPSVSISPPKKLMRSSTTAKSVETKKRVQERQKLESKRREIWKSKRVAEITYTQEELLEECKITEKINIEALGMVELHELHITEFITLIIMCILNHYCRGI